jgi:hypothetical protein
MAVFTRANNEAVCPTNAFNLSLEYGEFPALYGILLTERKRIEKSILGAQLESTRARN